MILLRPTLEQIYQHLNISVDADRLTPPTKKKEEWNKNHRDYVLHVLLPSIRPPKRTWLACIEAYLTDVQFEYDHDDLKIDNQIIKKDDILSFEQVLCDGSSVIPDIAYKWGNIKDPWGVAHDYIFCLNRHKYKDVSGKKWSLVQANSMYRDGWIAQGSPVIGNLWWFGLAIGSWAAWKAKFHKKSKYTKYEKITEWEYKKDSNCNPFIEGI